MIQDRSSEGPYKDGDVIDVGGRVSKWVLNGYSEVKIANVAHAEGRKSAENYTEKMLVCAKDEVRKCHEEIRRLEDKYARNVYRMPGSLEKEFKELLELANELAMNLDSFTDEAGKCHVKFHAWKKARGI